MADEIKDLDTEETSATADEFTAPATVEGAAEPLNADAESGAVADATGDDGQQSLDLPATEGEADPKPEPAAGEELLAGDEGGEAIEADPTPVDLEDHGTSEALTLAAGESNDAPADDSTPAGAEEAAPEAPSTPDLGAPEAQPNVGVPEADEEPSVSTGIGGDKAEEVTPPDAPKLEPEQPTPLPAPSMFNSGTPVKVPDTSIALEDGYPVAQPDAAPVHPCHFGELQNDGVGDDAGKVVDAPRYPVPADTVTVVSGGDQGGSEPAAKGGDIAAQPPEEPAEEPKAEDAAPVTPEFESRMDKLFARIDSIETNLSRLLHELLD